MSSVRQNYEKSLLELQENILKMGGLVERAIANSVDSLSKQDVALAEDVIARDDEIDEMTSHVEEYCIRLIATQQPLAKDLRRIITAIKISTDLERIADYAVDIARVTRRIGTKTLIKPLIDIPRMTVIIQRMVHEALDAYVREDVNLAKKLAQDDDEVDKIHGLIFKELLSFMIKEPDNISQAASLLFVSKHLERIGDHATNLGESVIYLVTGEREELNS